LYDVSGPTVVKVGQIDYDLRKIKSLREPHTGKLDEGTENFDLLEYAYKNDLILLDPHLNIKSGALKEWVKEHLDDLWSHWFAYWVPRLGAAETVAGEIIRAMGRLRYRYWNDGDMAGVGYGNETCNSSNRYLLSHVYGYKDLDYGGLEKADDYERDMADNHFQVVIFLLTIGQILFFMYNTENSRKRTEEDRRRSDADCGIWGEDEEDEY
jgi:hypothetical protein